MAVVLAIDTGSMPGGMARRLQRELAGHEIVRAASYDEALATIDRRLPDLVLFPVFFSASEEAAMMARLRGLSSADQVSALRIPLLASAALSRQGAKPRWFYWFKPLADGVGAASESPVRPAGTNVPPFGLLPTSPGRFDPAAVARAVEAPVRSATRLSAALLPNSVRAFAPREWASQLLSKVTWRRQPVAPTLLGRLSEGEVSAPPLFESAAAPLPAVEIADASPPAAENRVPQSSEDIVPAAVTVPQPVKRPAAPTSRMLNHVPRPSASPAMRRLRSIPQRVWLSGMAAVILIGVGVALVDDDAVAARLLSADPPTGIAELHSVPNGSEVWADGKMIGVTPLDAPLSVGQHQIELRYENATQSVELDIVADQRTVHHVDFEIEPVGALRLISNPAGASVSVDGQNRGVTPLTLEDVPTGRHTVVFESSTGTVRRLITVEADQTATAEASIFSGWVAVFAPFELQVWEGGRRLRLDEEQQVMVSPGRHEIRLTNEALGYVDSRTVSVSPGEVTRVSVSLPETKVSISTTPEAEVWLDGVSIGVTPLEDLPVGIGTRELVFRNPIVGERRIVRTLTTAPLRLEFDLANPVE